MRRQLREIERFAIDVLTGDVAEMMRDLPQIVDPVAMIGMVVGDHHPGEIGGFGGEQLFAHVGAAIDQHPRARAFDKDR